MISTRNLNALPRIPTLIQLTQSLATLDAIMQRDWNYRYYAFDAHWDKFEKMAAMRNGSGDEWYLLFSPAGAILKGFAHESIMNDGPPWPGVLSSVPAVFESFLTQSAFDMEHATFCVWRTNLDTVWHTGPVDFPPGPDPDGSANLLKILDGNPQSYVTFARDYFEHDPPFVAVDHIYRHRRLTQAIVSKLNPKVAIEDLVDDLAEIGYPA